MADSSANSIARKCRKPDSIVVMVKSDQADTPRWIRSHSPNFTRMLVILAVSFPWEAGTKGNQTKRTCRRSFYRHPAGFLTSGWTLLTHRVCLQGFKGRPEPVSPLALCRQKQCWPCSIAVLVSFWRESKQKRWLRLSPWWCFPASEERPSLFTKVEWCIWLSHVWKSHLFPPLTY